jgi:acetyl esterase/lipase
MISTDLAPLRIAYGRLPDQFGDLYLPTGARIGLPVVVMLHGGWWKDNQTLDSYRTRALVSWLLARGDVAVWNLEFRRMQATGENTQAPWPATLADVAAGFDHLATLSSVDCKRVIAIGHSAGAHLAAWAACRTALPPANPLRGLQPVVPEGVGLVAGVLCLDQPEDLEQPDQVRRLLGGTPAECQSRRVQSCPHALAPGLRLSGFCLHGLSDPVVSSRQAKTFVQAAGDGIDLHLLKDATHFSMLPGDDMKEAHWCSLTGAISGLLASGPACTS